jgi:hypothetical protein
MPNAFKSFNPPDRVWGPFKPVMKLKRIALFRKS